MVSTKGNKGNSYRPGHAYGHGKNLSSAFHETATGTAFTVGSVTYFEDWALRKKLLKTGELAGTTWRRKGKSHYLLADVALVGEAIMLAMRTSVEWK